MLAPCAGKAHCVNVLDPSTLEIARSRPSGMVSSEDRSRKTRLERMVPLLTTIICAVGVPTDSADALKVGWSLNTECRREYPS